ncbi:MAG: FAD-dependent oxidoreductase [Deltaproteobacteria bacterium]|nr:FAD-dependent oxidoreductase [Deltaproteobacteria bacterium]
MSQRYDAIILGAGPAGLTAAIYLGRNRLKPLVVDTGSAGGQMVLSYVVANYPGVETTSGREISQTMLRQARSFGAEVLTQATVTELDLTGATKRVSIEDEGEFEAPVVVVATGGTPRQLGLESEQRLKGRGISYCATCDGDFFTDKAIVVIGGGNSALEEAVSLTRYASKVTVVHLLDEFQAQPWALSEAEANPKIELLNPWAVVEFEGEEHLERVIIEHQTTGERRTIEAEGTFIFIGYQPNTEWLGDQIALNDHGEVIADEQMSTNLPGVYVAGDNRVKRYRQITTAVSDGTIAALAASEYLQNLQRDEAPPTSPAETSAQAA